MPRVGTFDLLRFAGCGVADRDLGLLIEVGFSSRVGDDKGVYVYVVVVVETVTVLVVAYKEDSAGNRSDKMVATKTRMLTQIENLAISFSEGTMRSRRRDRRGCKSR